MALPKLVVEIAARIREYMADMDRAATATEVSAARIERADRAMVDAARGVASGQADVADTAVQVASRMGPMGGAVAAAAAVVAGYAVVSYKAAQENTALVKALALSGNQAGVTAGQMHDMAEAGQKVGRTHGQAIGVLSAMASTGKVTASMMEQLTATTLEAQRSLGISAEETIKRFAALADEPVKASLKLAESTNHLTVAAYERIKALEDMGRKDLAAIEAQKAYDASARDAAARVNESLGTVQKAWRSAGEMASWAWDRFMGLGRKETTGQRLNELGESIANLEAQIRERKTVGFNTQLLEAELAKLRDRQGILQSDLRLNKQIANAQAEQAAKVQAIGEWDKKGLAYRDKQAKLEDDIAEARQLGLQAGRSEEEIEKRIAAIREKAADKSPRGKAASDEYGRLGAEIQKQLDLANQQLVVGRQLTESEKFHIDTLSKIDEALRKKNITQAQATQLIRDMTIAEAARQAVEDKAKRIKIDQALFAQQVQNMEDEAAYNVARSKAWEQSQLALVGYNQSVQDQIDLTQVELGLVGQTQQSRDLALTYYRIALELKKQIRAIDESEGYDSEADREVARARARATAAKARLNAETQSQVTEWNRVFDQVENGLTDALMRGFEAGKSMFANLRDYAGNLFKTLVLRPIVSAIVSPVSGAIAGMVAPAVASAGTNLLSSAGSAAGIANLFGGSGALATASGAISGFTTAVTAGAQSLIGMTGTASQMVTSLTAAGHVAAPGMAAGVGAGQAALTAIPYVAVGALIANAIGLFRTTKTVGGGLTGTLGQGDINAYDLTRKSGTLFSGPDYRVVDKGVSPQSAALQTAFTAMRSHMVGMVDTLGLGTDAIKAFTTSIGNDVLHPDTGGKGLKLDGLTAEQAAAKVQEALAAANEKMAQTALASANLTGWMARLAEGQTTAAGTLQTLAEYPNKLLELAGTSRDALVQAFTDGLMTGDAAAAGQAVADTLVASIERTMVGNASAQIFDIVNVGIVTPMLDAIMAGQAVSQAISQQAMDAVVAKATAAAQALGQVMSDAGFQAAMDKLRTAVSGALGTAGAALAYQPKYQIANNQAAQAAAQQAAKEAADASRRAAENAQRAAEEAQRAADTYANALRDAQDYIAGVAKTVGEWVDAQNANTANPTNNLASARAAFAAQMAFARGGDRDAINGITGYADRLLQAGSERLGYIQQQQLLAQTKAQLIDLPKQLSPEQFIVEQLTPIISAVPLPVVSAIGTASDSQVQATNALAANYAAALQPVISALGTGFATLDTNLSNDLTLAELTTALQGKATDAAINALFGLIDTDNDAIIGKLEASVAASLTFGQQVKLGLASEFTKLDTSVNGLLDATEFTAAFAGLATDATLQAVFNEIDTNGDGIITAVEAQTAANNTLFAALGAALNAGFATLDTNLSGGITQPELAAVMQGKASDAAINALFDLIDVDNDSIISKLEATTAAALTFGQQVASGLSADFTKLDTSVNGLLDFTEFSTAFAGLATNATLQAVFNELDANGNGQLSKLEAIAANTVAMSAGVTFSATDPIHSVFDAIKESTGSSAYYLGTITSLIHQVEMQLARTHNLLGSIGYFINSAYSGTGSFQIRGATSYFAKGGVFSNQVVSSPTLFNMAMMGEAGDEAIMPLSRGADGRLGVTAQVQMPDWSQYGRSDNAALVAEIKRLNDRLARIEAATTAAAVHSADSADSLRNIKNNGLEVFNDPATPLVTEAAP